jgi:hypothetical protein
MRPPSPPRSELWEPQISLIVSAATAAASTGAVFITHRLGHQRFDHERRLSDVDSARRVLDDAASTMQRTNSLLGSVTARLDTSASTLPSRPWNKEMLQSDAVTLKNAGDELTSLAARLRIRFGSKHELVTVYESAESIALGVAFHLELMGLEAQDQGAGLDSPREKIDLAAREFNRARDLFTLIAYRVVGTNLPVVPVA